jgi:HTH-type transcriptional regulator, sugar sensing transcriptional regulator
MPKSEYIHPLMDLGFTELEAEVYSALLQESPVTGYRVAQITGRLPGNVYKALESLQSKGAIIIDEGASRMCRAVPPTELLSMLRRRYLEAESRAAKALEELHEVSEDNRVYQIRSYDQVMQRARTMIVEAKATIAADLFPSPMSELAADLQAAAKRGVIVGAKKYEADYELAEVALSYNIGGESLVARSGRDWVILMTDGMELLIASADRSSKQIVEAFWTRSTTLAYIFHCAMAAEFAFCKVNEMVLSKDITIEQVRAAARMFSGQIEPQVERGGMLAESILPYVHMYGSGVPGFFVMERGMQRKEATEAALEERNREGSELKQFLDRMKARQ